MKILSANQIREVDSYTILHEPVASADLMERAALVCANWVKDRYPSTFPVKIFAGLGNNGGDGLAIAYLLISSGYNVTTYILNSPEKFSTDALNKFERLQLNFQNTIKFLEEPNCPDILPSDIVIDALFGTGLTRPANGYAAKLICHINISGATVVSIDIPSGLFSDSDESNNRSAIIQAAHTLTFELPKLMFMFPDNSIYTGTWHLLKIGLHPKAIDIQECENYYQEASELQNFIKPRSRFAHKGSFGHALLFAGSFGKIGAAVLASKACLKSGVGLLTTHLPRKGYEILQISSPETMVSLDVHYDVITEVPALEKYSAIGMGPGMGKSDETVDVLREIITKSALPLVLDADAINILAEHQWLLNMIPPNTIITPHLKEFERLAGTYNSGYKRYLAQIDFSQKYNLIINIYL